MKVRVLVALIATLAATGAWPIASLGSAASAPAPNLTPVKLKGYTVGLSGSHWPASSPITFSLAQRGLAFGFELQSTSAGSFQIGIRTLNQCYGEVDTARDLNGEQATIVADPLPCPYPQKPTTPTFSVLAGTLMSPLVTRVNNQKLSAAITFSQTDIVYLWQKGKKTPGLVPSAPHTYFSLVDQGQINDPTCTGPPCKSGFFWTWVGVKAGSTHITLRPPCKSKPCPDFVIEVPVTITARPAG